MQSYTADYINNNDRNNVLAKSFAYGAIGDQQH